MSEEQNQTIRIGEDEYKVADLSEEAINLVQAVSTAQAAVDLKQNELGLMQLGLNDLLNQLRETLPEKETSTEEVKEGLEALL